MNIDKFCIYIFLLLAIFFYRNKFAIAKSFNIENNLRLSRFNDSKHKWKHKPMHEDSRFRFGLNLEYIGGDEYSIKMPTYLQTENSKTTFNTSSTIKLGISSMCNTKYILFGWGLGIIYSEDEILAKNKVENINEDYTYLSKKGFLGSHGVDAFDMNAHIKAEISISDKISLGTKVDYYKLLGRVGYWDNNVFHIKKKVTFGHLFPYGTDFRC